MQHLDWTYTRRTPRCGLSRARTAYPKQAPEGSHFGETPPANAGG